MAGELQEQIGDDLPVSLSVRTPSGGVHVYFTQPKGDPIRNRGNLPEHIDVRGEGGYVVVPPSVTADGRRYRWVRDDPAATIVAAPPKLIEILQARKGATLDGGPPRLRIAGGTDPRQATLNDFNPTGIVMHPSDFIRASLVKDAAGAYIMSNPAGATARTLWVARSRRRQP